MQVTFSSKGMSCASLKRRRQSGLCNVGLDCIEGPMFRLPHVELKQFPAFFSADNPATGSKLAGILVLVAALSLLALKGEAQAAPPAGQSLSPTMNTPTTPQGGSATAGVFAPVLDSEKRPITAGGFVKDGPVIFKDIAKEAGLTIWQHKMGTLEKTFILEQTGSGVGLIDYDNDGWLDIYMVNGSTYDG